MENNINWSAPTPIRANAARLTPFPLAALPPVLKDFAEAVSVSTSTDPAMAATALLSSLSYCFSGVYRVQGKSDHTEPLVLDSLIIAEPSTKKSPVISAVKKPYADFVTDWNEQHKPAIFKAQAEKKLLDQRLSDLEKSGESGADDIAALKTKLSNFRDSDFRRIIVDDITPESLAYQLKQNGTLLMISDEAGMLGNFSGRYSNNVPNLDLLLKSWNGESYISDRATRESISLKRPYMSVCLAAQPYVWEGMISNPVFRGSGLIARLIYCFPKSNIGDRKYDTKPVSPSISEIYKLFIYRLLEGKFEYNSTYEKLILLDKNAYSKFVKYYNEEIEKMLLGEMSFCQDWGGKYHGLILRIAGILHCSKCAFDCVDPADTKADIDTLSSAIEIGEYYRKQAIYAYGVGDVDLGIVKAERVLAKIRSKYIREIRQNDLYKLCRCSLFSGAKDFSDALEMLEEYGYIRRESIRGANNNPKTALIVHVNPKIYELSELSARPVLESAESTDCV